MDLSKDDTKTIVTYSLKASETQNEDSDIYSFLQIGYANTSETDYKLSQFQVLNKQKFAPEDFEQAMESGKLSYLKACDQMHISPCTKLLYMLDRNESIIKLSHYGLGPKGTIAFSTIIPMNSNLIELRLNNNSIDVSGAKSLFQALQNNASPIEIIDLSKNNFGAISVQNECCTELCNLLKQNNSIRQFSATECNLTSLDIKLICDGLKQNTTLNKLDLSKNNFNDSSWEYVSEAIKENAMLQVLNMSWNSMSDHGFEQVIDGLNENAGLRTLNISWCSIQCLAMSTINKLGKLLEEQEYIESLDLSHNDITDKAIESLMKGIEQTSLKELNIECNPFSGNGTILLKEALKESNIKRQKFNGSSVAKRDIGFKEEMKEYDAQYQQVIDSNENIVRQLNALKEQKVDE